MEKEYKFSENKYYARVVPYLDELFYNPESGHNGDLYDVQEGFGLILSKEKGESLHIEKSGEHDFCLEIKVSDENLLNNLEKISKGEGVEY